MADSQENCPEKVLVNISTSFVLHYAQLTHGSHYRSNSLHI